MADGIYYRDMRQPFVTADQSAITLSTTQKALWAPALTILPANYWTVGKTVKLTASLKLVTDGTAGNYVFGMAYGAGDAPAPIVISASRAAVVSFTGHCVMEGYATCSAVGTAGTLRQWGFAIAELGAVLSTAQPITFPTAGVVTVSTIDTTVGTNALTFQLQRSGAGVYTATTTGLIMEALN
jgi:hypothetical protein